jgi:hypothetical protein
MDVMSAICSMHEVNTKYSKTSLIRTNCERTLVQISESPNSRGVTENMSKEVIKWISRLLLENKFYFET